MSGLIEDIRTGTSVATLTSAGSLGIGTSDPSAIFDVKGTTKLATLAVSNSISANCAVTMNDILTLAGLKSGTDQANAGAGANELWIDTTSDRVIKVGS